MLILDLMMVIMMMMMTMIDDDVNCSEQDDWLLDVPVLVLQLFVDAISFDDSETMSITIVRNQRFPFLISSNQILL